MVHKTGIQPDERALQRSHKSLSDPLFYAVRGSLLESYKVISREHRDLITRFGNAQDKVKLQQSTMQILQRSLEQSQSPDLPRYQKKRGFRGRYGIRL